MMACSKQISTSDPDDQSSPRRLQITPIRSKKHIAYSEGSNKDDEPVQAAGPPSRMEEYEDREDVGNTTCWNALLADVQDHILTLLDYKHLFPIKSVSKSLKTRIESDAYHGYRGKILPGEGLLTALHFSLSGANGVLQCAGYDLVSNSWFKLPPFHVLPPLDPALFKDHSICAAGGIMCANVSTSSSAHEKLVAFNPLTGRWVELPPLNNPRQPVLIQLIMTVDPSGEEFYRVVAAGSAKAGGDKNLSKVTEIFDFRTSQWAIAQDMPGPVFALNEHQTGVYLNGILYCVAFLEGAGRGVVAFSVEQGTWLPHLSCPLPNPMNLNIVQLVECNGEVVLFSEVEHNRVVEHRIDVLEEVGKWRNVVSETKVSSQAGLQVYPEYACVPFGDGKVCVFNTIVHSGVVYDVRSGARVGVLPEHPWSVGTSFYSMNPLTFTFAPSFKGNPEAWLHNAS